VHQCEGEAGSAVGVSHQRSRRGEQRERPAEDLRQPEDPGPPAGHQRASRAARTVPTTSGGTVATITPPTLEPVEDEIETEVALVGEDGEPLDPAEAEARAEGDTSEEAARKADSGDDS